MNNVKDTIWQTKLAARIHDPAEKALVLLRDPAGHENGTSRALARLLGFSELAADNIDPDNDEVLSTVIFKKGIPLEMYKTVQLADWWAAAADRPQWPMQEIIITTKKGEQKTLKVADWAQVRWTKKPVLIHPLTGEQFNLGKHGGLSDTDFHDIKQRSFDHFSRLLVTLGEKDEEQDWKKILLTYWRFGPELIEDEDFGKLGELWRMLPADTRVPDHSIWDHLDLTSAFAGAFAADPEREVALLALSIGPVQPFIAAARKMEDLWAGSHLLARLAWEAMKPVCESLGPDAILFPRLRGVPQVDLWLRDQAGLPDELFKNCDWRMKGGTDANPLFSAALPNRFVAVVPRCQVEAIALKVKENVRSWLKGLGEDVVSRLLDVSGFDVESTSTPYEQMKDQLDGFPEIHWAAIPFSLIKTGNKAKQTDLDPSMLSEVMAPFFGVEPGKPCGFLDTPAWKLLQQELELTDADGRKTVFFSPNPGVLYPAVYDLAERVLVAAKAIRQFKQTEQKGWRCSLTGETEWLTDKPDYLTVPAGKRRSSQDKRGFKEHEHVETLWTKVANEESAWAKKGEHLGALPAIKRLWPTIFAKEVGEALAAGQGGEQKNIGRFVVSTHSMALAHQLDQWLENGGHTAEDMGSLFKKYRSESVALPRRLMRRHSKNPALKDAKLIPGLLDVTVNEDVSDSDVNEIKRLVRKTLSKGRKQDAEIKLETYYAFIMMDGDHMGKILSGDDNTAIAYRDSFYPDVQNGFDEHAAHHDLIRQYGQQKRALSPNRHLAISGALNDFSLTVVRQVVEEEHLGRVIYAGGDDVLAMLPVVDMLPAMQRLRFAYSGHDPEHEGGTYKGLTLHKGFALLNGKLMRMMGRNATASCGAVIAHHQTPLAAVRRELDAAEKRAKNEVGRNAFSITVIKRSGGALRLTAQWGEPLALINDLQNFLTDPGVSRRAVYHTLEWLKEQELPALQGDGAMLQTLLAYQFDRQTDTKADKAKAMVKGLAQRLTQLALQEQEKARIKWLRNFLSVAEFLARETRAGGES